jgi:hypothetical protein
MGSFKGYMDISFPLSVKIMNNSSHNELDKVFNENRVIALEFIYLNIINLYFLNISC